MFKKNTLLLIFLLFNCAFAQNSEVIVYFGSEDAEGITQVDFNLELLQAIELKTKNKIKEKAEAYLNSQGFKGQKIDFQSSSVYVQIQNMKLAVVRVVSSGSNQVHIFGIRGKELLRVACVTQSSTTIPLSYGKCGEKIKDVYKVDIAKGSN
jgi:hypothetical protein